MKRLVLILGDQCSLGNVALKEADRDNDIIVMAEVADEAHYVPHHPKKIALILSNRSPSNGRLICLDQKAKIF